MTTIRAPRNENSQYFATARAAAQDKTLSLEARGLLWYLLSKPSNWRVIIKDLMTSCGIGRDKTYKLLAELKDKGYIVRECTRKPDGTFVWGDYRIIEAPQRATTEEDEPLPENQEMDTREPFPENPYPVNQEIRSQNIEDTKTPTTSVVVGAEEQPPVVSDFKAIGEMLVRVVFDGNAKMWGMAGLIANWLLCNRASLDKPKTKQWLDMLPEYPFTPLESEALLLWYADKKIAWPISPIAWNKQAWEFRKSSSRARYMKVAQERHAPTTTLEPTPYELAMEAANKAAELAAAS